MSTINTNGIDATYPVPGVNNNSQGFRDNFTSIKTNLNTAGTEITDLQNKVVVKSALNNTTVNNDMANTLISNALTRSFRASTYNLGNSISGSLVVNVSLGDVQYGTIAGNTIIQFAGWAPAGTQSNVQLELAVSNANAVISFPSQVSMNGSYGVETLENFANIANVATVSVPSGVTQLEYRLSTVDCGNTITIEPFNRPRQTSQIVQRAPSPIGQPGDTNGTVSIDPSTSLAFATCTATEGTYDVISCDSTAGFYLDMPIEFNGVTFGGVVAGETYYVRTIPTPTTFTISTQPGTVSGPSSAVNLSTASGTMTVSPISYIYVASGAYDANTLSRIATTTTQVLTTTTASNTTATGNVITVSSTTGLVSGYPVTFSGSSSNSYITATYTGADVVTVSTTTNMVVGGSIRLSGTTFGGLTPTTYYITNIYPGNSNITLSTTFGGGNVTLSSASGNCVGTFGGVFGNISANTTYYVKDIFTGNSRITVSTTTGGANTALTTENGLMTVSATTDYVVTLNSTTSIANNDPIIFTGTMFGGLVANTVYYVENVTSPNISISLTRYNGVAGQKTALTTGSGNAIATIYQGTSIWKRTQLSSW
jgi:hypothetical protein